MIIILTAIVGNTEINCFDGKYDKHKLKLWADKNLIKCPVCGNTYEYCHGEYISPYFRHKDKNKCEGFYGEPETEEHIKGKIALFNWIKEQQNTQNHHLEYWIPETKQRPDIYFESDDKRYVIEFQCSPIASEYKKRHELYQLAGINDIWILGTDKYSIDLSNEIHHTTSRFREIEKENGNNQPIYFNTKDKKYVFDRQYLLNGFSGTKLKELPSSDYLPRKIIFDNELLLSLYAIQRYAEYAQNNIKYFRFKNGSISFADKFKDQVLKESSIIHENYLNIKTKICLIVKNLNTEIKKCDDKYEFDFYEGQSDRYVYSLRFHDHYFFVNADHIDYCQRKEYSRRFRNHNNRMQWGKFAYYENLDSTKVNSLTDNDIYDFVLSKIKEMIQPFEDEKKRKREKLIKIADVINKSIYITDTDYIVPSNIRFKYIKEHCFWDLDYIVNDFAPLIRKLKNKSQIVFLLRGSNSADECVEQLKSFGFINISKLPNCMQRK